MKFNPGILRRMHRTAALCIAGPLLIIVSTGLILHLRKESSWIEPPEVGVPGSAFELSVNQIPNGARRALPDKIRGWEDVDSVNIQPRKGLVIVRTVDRWEVQLHPTTADTLQVVRRRVDLIQQLHDGSWFGQPVKFAVFFTSGLLLTIVLGSGLFIFLTRPGKRPA